MANKIKNDFPAWKPQMSTAAKFESDSFRIRYKALRNSSSAFIKREDVKREVFRKCGGRCALCGDTEKLQVDHIVSVYRCAKGEIPIRELNMPENLQLLCAHCNARKSP